jgi:hypothetical protein
MTKNIKSNLLCDVCHGITHSVSVWHQTALRELEPGVIIKMFLTLTSRVKVLGFKMHQQNSVNHSIQHGFHLIRI